MTKTLKLISLIALVFLLSACGLENKNEIKPSNNEIKKAEKIEIYNFHSTNQCYSCVYIGDMMFKIVDTKFKEEYQSGKIVFKKINVDKPENKEVANKYQARGSSLFFNMIIDGKENISEDISVWRLVGNDQVFQNYIIKKINDNLK